MIPKAGLAAGAGAAALLGAPALAQAQPAENRADLVQRCEDGALVHVVADRPG